MQYVLWLKVHLMAMEAWESNMMHLHLMVNGYQGIDLIDSVFRVCSQLIIELFLY